MYGKSSNACVTFICFFNWRFMPYSLFHFYALPVSGGKPNRARGNPEPSQGFWGGISPGTTGKKDTVSWT